MSKHGDKRQYTIWETLENTAKKKSDRLYFIIDEAHRGMQGTEAGKATSIMQRFLKGSRNLGLSPMPVVIGVSATAERFNQLVGNTTSTLNKHVISPNEVRGSGLLGPVHTKKYSDIMEEWNYKKIRIGPYSKICTTLEKTLRKAFPIKVPDHLKPQEIQTFCRKILCLLPAYPFCYLYSLTILPSFF